LQEILAQEIPITQHLGITVEKERESQAGVAVGNKRRRRCGCVFQWALCGIPHKRRSIMTGNDDKLLDIHHLIQREGYLDVPFHIFFIVARKG